MSERRWLPELDEHDRDLYETELAYERWLSGQPQPRPVVRDERDDGYDPRDPDDQQRSEGGRL